MTDKIECEDLGLLPNGAHLYREPDGAGGYKYMSDEISGGVNVWTTSLISEETLLAAICCDHNRKFIRRIMDTKQGQDVGLAMEMEKCAATGGTFIPAKTIEPFGKKENFDTITDWLKIRAVTCYLAYMDTESTHNMEKATAAQFDKGDYSWKKDWVRVARVCS